MALAFRRAPIIDAPANVETVVRPARPRLSETLKYSIRKQWSSVPPNERFILAAHYKIRPDVWYVNTVMQPDVIKWAKRERIPCILHTHELAHMLHSLNKEEMSECVNYPSLILASSQAAKDVFSTLGRERDIEVCYPPLNPAEIKTDAQAAQRLRASLGIPDETFIWLMAGSLDPNKNPVRLVQIAQEMLRAGLNAHFIWLGWGESGYSSYTQAYAKNLGVSEKISWLMVPKYDYYDCLNAADGFVLTSSHESFSIVSAEAAYLGKPIVAFDCGGVAEIVKPRMGIVIKSWNNSDLITAMAAIMSGQTDFDPAVSRTRVREFFIEAQGERWLRIVRKYFAKGV